MGFSSQIPGADFFRLISWAERSRQISLSVGSRFGTPPVHGWPKEEVSLSRRVSDCDQYMREGRRRRRRRPLHDTTCRADHHDCRSPDRPHRSDGSVSVPASRPTDRLQNDQSCVEWDAKPLRLFICVLSEREVSTQTQFHSTTGRAGLAWQAGAP